MARYIVVSSLWVVLVVNSKPSVSRYQCRRVLGAVPANQTRHRPQGPKTGAVKHQIIEQQ